MVAVVVSYTIRRAADQRAPRNERPRLITQGRVDEQVMFSSFHELDPQCFGSRSRLSKKTLNGWNRWEWTGAVWRESDGRVQIASEHGKRFEVISYRCIGRRCALVAGIRKPWTLVTQIIQIISFYCGEYSRRRAGGFVLRPKRGTVEANGQRPLGAKRAR